MLQTQSIDIGRSLSHMQQDQDWLKKVGIGALVGLVPILNFAGVGYGLQVLKNSAEGNDTPLPEWSDLGAKLTTGLKFIVGQLVYALPLILLMCVAFVPLIGAAAAADGASNDAAAAAMMGGSVLSLCMFGLMIPYMLFLFYVAPALQIQFVRNNEEIGSMFRFKEIFAIARANSGEYIKVLLVMIGVSFAIGLVASIPILGTLVVLVLAPVLTIMSSHLAGQYKRITNQ